MEGGPGWFVVLLPIALLVVLLGSLAGSAFAWFRGRRLSRFRQAQRIARKRERKGRAPNPRGRQG